MSTLVSTAPVALRACSACSGDYEDPERTASDADENEILEADAEREEASPRAEQFPVW